MTVAFLEGATGDPINLKRRLALQSVRGIPPIEAAFARGVLTFTGVTVDTETVTIGGRVYEFDSVGGVGGGNIPVDISGGASAAQSVAALVAAINGDGPAIVTAVDGPGDTVQITADTAGTAGNAIGTTEACANASWGAATLTGGVDDPYVDFRTNGGPLLLTPGVIPRLVINPGGAPLADLNGKVILGGGPMQIGDVDPANRGMLRGLANFFGHYARTDNTTWQKWVFGLDGATAAAQFLAWLEDTDVLPRIRALDIIITSLRVSASPNNNLAIEFGFVAGEYDLHGAVTQEVGFNSTLPQFKRTWQGNWNSDATDSDIWIKFIADNGDGTWDVRVKVGAAAAYLDERIFTLGAWNRLYDQAGARLGIISEQVLARLPVGAVIAVNDEFKVPMRRIAWTQTLTTDRPISSVNTDFILGGNTIRVEGGWEWLAQWESSNAFQDTAGRQGATSERSGKMIVTITPTKRIVDLTIQEAIHQGRELSIVMNAETDATIGSSGRGYRFACIAPKAKPSGALFGVQPGGQNREEAPVFRAADPAAGSGLVYDGATYDSHFHVLVENAETAL